MWHQSEESPGKDCPYSYALLSVCFPLALQEVNEYHPLNILLVCHTMTDSPVQRPFCISTRLLQSRCVSRGSCASARILPPTSRRWRRSCSREACHPREKKAYAYTGHYSPTHHPADKTCRNAPRPEQE